MNSWIKNSLWIVGWAVIGVFLTLFCDSQTKGFRVTNITKTFPFDPKWETVTTLTPEEESKVLLTLDSPFYFLSKGGTADVFKSQDDQYVIKFFRKQRFFPPFWATWKISQYFNILDCQKTIARKTEHKELQFSSYKMALDDLKEQTGMVYLHLNPTTHLKKTITLYDRIGIKHSIEADQITFALQKKAIPFPVHFKKLLADGNIPEAKKVLSQFALFLHERAAKGIRDADIGPRFNLGFLDGSIMTFDVDQLRRTKLEPNKQTHMLQDAKETFHWLSRKDPQLVSFLREEIIRLQPYEQ